MGEKPTDAPKPRRKQKHEPVAELNKEIDERDETVRRLNEALSLALAELMGEHRAAA
jgi:hypothetical protein